MEKISQPIAYPFRTASVVCNPADSQRQAAAEGRLEHVIAWRPFTNEGGTYDLAHLHPRGCTFVQAAKGDKPERVYAVHVGFSSHCFTRRMADHEGLDHPFCYSDSRETRIFDFRRYELSRNLPEIIDALPATKCFHTGHGNFFVVRRIDDATGQHVDYEVYFDAFRSNQHSGALDLVVRSAFVRDRHHPNQPRYKPIGFLIVLYNRLNNRPIATPQ